MCRRWNYFKEIRSFHPLVASMKVKQYIQKNLGNSPIGDFERITAVELFNLYVGVFSI